MNVSKQIIQNFIKKNSSTITRERAKEMNPVETTRKDNEAIFLCIGSTHKLYTITITAAKDDKSVSAECTCPYDFGGLCKHAVASLTRLGGISRPKPTHYTTAVLENNILQLQEGVITDEGYNGISFMPSRYYYTMEVEVTDMTRERMVFVCKEYRKHTVKLTYNKDADTLQVACSCPQSKPFCEHTQSVMETFFDRFGPFYFSQDYEKKMLENYLENNGYENNARNRNLFGVVIGQKGIKIEERYKNLMPKSRIEAIENYSSDANRIETLAKPAAQAPQATGLGFCFDFHEGTLTGFYPFFAKWNKAHTELSSKFEALTEYELGSSLKQINQYTHRATILDGIELGARLYTYYRDIRNIDYHKTAYYKLTELAKNLTPHPLYEKDRSDSLNKRNIRPIKIADVRAELVYKLDEIDDFYTLKAHIRIGQNEYPFDDETLDISPFVVKRDETLYLYHNYEHAIGAANALHNDEYTYFKEDKSTVWNKVVKPLSKSYEIQTNLAIPAAPTDTVAEEPRRQVYVSDYENSSIVFRLAVGYGDQLVEPGSHELLSTGDSEYEVAPRNKEEEDAFVDFFKSLHPNFDHNESVYVLAAEDLIQDNWFMESTAMLKEAGVEIYGANKLKSFLYNLNKATVSTSVKSDIDWFDVDIAVTFGDQVASLKELKKSFVTKSKYVKLDDGTLGILPDKWMDKFKNFFTAGEVKKDGIRISNYSFGIIDELYHELEVKPDFLEELYLRKQRLFNLSEITKIPKPRGLKATLRDYQHEGLNWMVFLHENKLGGCLADDMGLGKTLQTIAFLKHLKNTEKPNKPSIIIAPTSLIFNWNQEIEKFCKSLKILTYTGTKRKEEIKNFSKTDLIITTYGTIINDIDFLQKEEFNYVILDESQAIKNPNSKRYKSVRLLQAYNRMVLTGTPIENNTFDLYAQLNFLNPGLLGSMAHFKQVFADGIDKYQDQEISALLHKIITPFVLRRTKEQVATELPEKTESIIYCEMGKEQKKVYDFYKKKYRDYLKEKVDENGVKKAQLYILEGLTKLRQVCNSTALVSTKEEDYGNEAVKLDTLTEHILDKTGQHKILVFSQFVTMLSLIKERLDSEGITYEYLDGATRDRQKCVENFQNNKDIRVFLISLKAGGTGLNLTEADYVYIVDPWWNPAVENQAIDRCYRIGQKKRVMAYRMICKDTIEEKIVKLQGKKKSVASSIIKMDEGSKSFDMDEVKDLFG